jgi:hypothetical protein
MRLRFRLSNFSVGVNPPHENQLFPSYRLPAGQADRVQMIRALRGRGEWIRLEDGQTLCDVPFFPKYPGAQYE